MYGARLASEGEVYMNCEVPEVHKKKPFYFDVVEEKPFMFLVKMTMCEIGCSCRQHFLKEGGATVGAR